MLTRASLFGVEGTSFRVLGDSESRVRGVGFRQFPANSKSVRDPQKFQSFEFGDHGVVGLKGGSVFPLDQKLHEGAIDSAMSLRAPSSQNIQQDYSTCPYFRVQVRGCKIQPEVSFRHRVDGQLKFALSLRVNFRL